MAQLLIYYHLSIFLIEIVCGKHCFIKRYMIKKKHQIKII